MKPQKYGDLYVKYSFCNFEVCGLLRFVGFKGCMMPFEVNDSNLQELEVSEKNEVCGNLRVAQF